MMKILTMTSGLELLDNGAMGKRAVVSITIRFDGNGHDMSVGEATAHVVSLIHADNAHAAMEWLKDAKVNTAAQYHADEANKP